jgi:asparagine synthetase B (glutamine-hydrolysing)
METFPSATRLPFVLQIKAMGVKMVLSGEGADELFGGYLYFHKAPNPDEFFLETRDKASSGRRATNALSHWSAICASTMAQLISTSLMVSPFS